MAENEAMGVSVLLEVLELVPPPTSSLSLHHREKVIEEIHDMKIAACRILEFVVRDITTLESVFTTSIVPILVELITPEKEETSTVDDDLPLQRAALVLLYLLSATDDSCQMLCQENVKYKLLQYTKTEEKTQKTYYVKLDKALNKMRWGLSNVAGVIFSLSKDGLIDNNNAMEGITNLELAKSLICRCSGGKWMDKVVDRLSFLQQNS